jgi:NhaP-type Na+/H+ or K+/H+ antiporter
MFDTATRWLNRFSDLVRLFILILIGVMMTGVGVVLARGGRPEAAIPLLFGAMAFLQLPKLIKNLYRDVTGNY